MPTARRRLAVLVAIVAALLPAATASAAIRDAAGAVVANTDAAGHLEGPAGCAAATACAPLADPGSPADDDPDAVAALGSPAAPEDDLATALDALAEAADAAAAADARDRALRILEGRLPGRAYSGIPLLNWNAPAKVKRVPAGGVVEVREVRFPDHTLTDTWLLDFEDPSAPYAIRYVVTEAGGAFGGELVPTPLLTDAGLTLGGLQSAVAPLATPALRTGTADANRFTAARGVPAAEAHEETRLATQTFTVRMPPAGRMHAILSPDRGVTPTSLATLAPATAARVAAASDALGFAGGEPGEAERREAIARLAPGAPEVELWRDLDELRPADDGFLAAARLAGEADRMLVAAMRSRTQVPPGVATDPAADVTVVLQNNETYVSRRSVRPAGGELVVEVVNRDGFARDVEALALHDSRAELGDHWGEFDWSRVAAGARVAAAPGDDPRGRVTTLRLRVPDGAFALWVGDPAGGDQAAAVLEVQPAQRTEALRLDASAAAVPLHQAIDQRGDHWVTLEGVDKVVRVTPAGELAASERLTVLLPGGSHAPTDGRQPLGPGDIAVDERGIVWVTLVAGNAIARIDPALVRDGTDAGVRIYPLPACDEEECGEVFPPQPGEAPTRQPLQLEVAHDAAGNTTVWFTEVSVDAIGAMRFTPDGTPAGEAHVRCGCTAPLGIALAPEGDVWFTEGVNNRLGRLTPDEALPLSAAAVRLRHYKIPSGVLTVEPEISRKPVVTSNPHSVTVDARGLVWFTESATSKLGTLDPERAVPGTSAGFREYRLPATRFGTPATPADLTLDREGTVYWTDEYGDAVGVMRTDGAPERWTAERGFEPTARRSLTDSPVADAAGNLWFVESAAGVLVRISGATAGSPNPAPAPRVSIDTRSGEIAVAGLRDAASVRVEVERGGGTVAAATAAVAGGAAAVAPAPLQAGDRVVLRPVGAGARAALVTTVPRIAAGAEATGRVSGIAQRGGRGLAGPALADGDAGRAAAIHPDSGAFAFAAPAATVAWNGRTPAAAWRFVAAVDPATATPQPQQPPPDPVAVPVTPSAPAAAPTPAQTPATPATTPQASVPCTTHWLTGRGARAQAALLGLKAMDVRDCFGAPRSSAGATWRYDGLELRFTRGRLTRMTITAPAWTSRHGGLRVGAHAAAVRAALPGARVDRRLGVRRAVLAAGGGRVADVRVRVEGGRVARIEVLERRVADLDATGRALWRERA